jgi:uncharacterized protein YdeI (YjbR/CyaY-like superfamily)
MATRKPDLPEVYPRSRAQWRRWLSQHHATSKGIWLVLDKKKSGRVSLTTEEAIEEALCFGWIDSRPNKLDDDRFLLLLTPRQPRSAWSKINRDRADRLIKNGLMTPAGQQKIDLAKKKGTWLKLLPFESRTLPADLAQALAASPSAKENYRSFTPSSQTQILRWIAEAKRPQTRAKRIEQTVLLAERGQKPNQYTPR